MSASIHMPAASAADRVVARGWGWPLAVFALALIPRLIGLGDRPFWLDEIFTLQRASLHPADLVLDSFRNHHMPSFFLMLAPLVHLGRPEFWLRLPSALFGAAAVALVYMIAARIAGRLAGVMAALVIGLSPMALAYSQEARSETMLMCLILVALYGVTLLAQTPAAAAGNPLAKPARAGWVVFTLGTAASIDVLGDGAFWLLAADLALLCLLPVVARRGALIANIVLANVAIFILCAPFYLLMMRYQIMSPGDAMGWIPRLTPCRLWYSLGSIYFMHLTDWVTFHLLKIQVPVIVWGIDAALVAALAAGCFKLRARPALLALLALSAALLPLVLSLVSLVKPVLLPRYLLWSAAPFAILAGIGLAAMLDGFTPRIRRLGVTLAALLLFINMAPYYHAETKPRWDLAGKMLDADVQPGDVIYLNDNYAGEMLNTYLPAEKRSALISPDARDMNKAAQYVSQGRRVWAVVGNAGQGTDQPDLQAFLTLARPLGVPSVIQMAGKDITIILYDPSTPHVAANPVVASTGG